MSKKPKMARSPKPVKTAKAAKAAKPKGEPANPDEPTPADFTGQPQADPVSFQSPAIPPAPTPAKPARGTKHMDLTLNLKPGARKSERLVIFDYTDRKGSVQFLRTLFGESIPQTITISGDFTEAPKPKAKETPEERKARLAALPKLTLAEKIAKAEERAARLRAKLAAEQAAEAVPA